MTQQKASYPLDYSKANSEAGNDRLRDLADAATDQLRHATDNAKELAGNAAEQAREYGEKAQELMKASKTYVEKSMKEQPLATLAVASVIGFVLGALWKK
jgi:ElaB/YqjD/DUF883 family membrane-anchored ribosome-binding protein